MFKSVLVTIVLNYIFLAILFKSVETNNCSVNKVLNNMHGNKYWNFFIFR